MKSIFRCGFFFVFILYASFYTIAFAAMNDVGVKVEWEYKGSKGPARWGQLSPQFVLCSQGRYQSPINITRNVQKGPNLLTINYTPAPLILVEDGQTDLTIGDTQTVIDDGHTIQVNFPADQSKESISFDGKEYRLVQFHTHSPSENQWHGRSFPLELHFVHQGDDGKLAVIGVFVINGQSNATLQKIIDNLPKEEGKEVLVKDVTINPYDLMPVKQDHYSFKGSLTTPPCSEGVQWIVMSNPITASAEQIAKLRSASDKFNARPIQPLNNRMITYSHAMH